jgi:lysophospholipase L1-like esterase
MNVQGERILIFGDSLSHPGADNGPSITDITVPLGVVSSAPGELIARQLLAAGAQAARVNAKVGRSARSFLSSEANLLASDRAFGPTKVVVFLGTNDIDQGTDAGALANTRDAMTQIRDAYRAMGAEVFAIGPPSYPNAHYNNAAPTMLALIQGVFGADHTVDARPFTGGVPRTSDGVHFIAESAAAVAPQLVRALLATGVVPAGQVSLSSGAKVALGFVAVAGFAGLSWLALRVAKHAAQRPGLGGLGTPDVKLIKRVAQLISYDVSKQDIREQLIADGYDDDDIFQAHQAAKVYLRRREIPDSNY